MEFQKRKTIYEQIGDALCEAVLTGKWKPGERIPSVRQYAVEMEVNPNTVMRTYMDLEEKGIIENQRGVGFFVAVEGPLKARTLLRKRFMEEELPGLFKAMSLLKVDFAEIQKEYSDYVSKKAGE